MIDISNDEPPIGLSDEAGEIITGAAARGAKMLDDAELALRNGSFHGVPVPWHDKIDLDAFDMTSVSNDILGQIWGDFNEGWQALAAVLGLDKNRDIDPEDQGFDMPSGVLIDEEALDPDDYVNFYSPDAAQEWARSALHAAWTDEIQARRGAKPPS